MAGEVELNNGSELARTSIPPCHSLNGLGGQYALFVSRDHLIGPKDMSCSRRDFFIRDRIVVAS